MTLWSDQHRRAVAIQFLAAWLWLLTSPLMSSEPPDSSELDQSFTTFPTGLELRIRQLEQNQQTLLEENHRLSSQLQSLSFLGRPLSTDSALDGSMVPPAPSRDNSTGDIGDVPVVNPPGRSRLNIFASPNFDAAEEFPLERNSRLADAQQQNFWAGYDRGFVIRPRDVDESPFELKINAQTQFRYSGFYRDQPSWTDSAGTATPLNNMSNFQIPRGRLTFSGFAFRKELLYNVKIDYNTVSSSQINFLMYWMAWRFNRAMTVYAGQGSVPGSREWLVSFINTQGPDRSMATTFFRPSLSQGIWATGEPTDGVFYHVMMSNGFNTIGSTPQQLNSLMAFSGSVWYEPLGEFGVGYSDFEWHDDPAIRVGTSLAYSPEAGPNEGSTAPENSAIRLSDGTLITQTGAFAPGATLNAFKIGLAAFDFAYKHQGFSLSGEFYSQDLFALRATGPIPQSSIYQFGGFAQAGYFLIPQKLEPYARTSHVTGPFGTGAEYAGGFNWFFLPEKRNLRFTLDAAWLNHSPADQNRTNYQAGQTGILVRSQLQILF